MLKSYEAFYDNGQLIWLGKAPVISKAKVIVVFEENCIPAFTGCSVKMLKGIAPKPQRMVTVEAMNQAI